MKRKIATGICLLYTALCAILAVILYMKGSANLGLIALSGVALGLLPIGILKFTKFELGLALINFYIIFLFGSQVLGSIAQFYLKYLWWDIFMHFISGILLAFLAVDLYKKLLRKDTVTELSAWFVFLFIFSFAIMGGVLWEVYEYTADSLFQMNLQHGNSDTMTDLLADSLGGLVASIWVASRL